MKRITIQIATKDRHSELGLLLQSLRTQSHKHWDVIILDDGSGSPITTCGFLVSLINRLKYEGHKVKLLRNEVSQGVCAARNKLIEEDTFGNNFACRLDDDCIPEQDYLERLMKVIEKGYDLASGVIPLIHHPEIKRDVKFIGDIINRHTLSSDGDLIENKDECGYCYIQEVILPTHQFRTNCLMKSEVQKKVRYPKNLTKTGFREEGFFSMKAVIQGFKIGVDTGAVAYHFSTPSGGTRVPTYNANVQLDDETFRKWIKTQYEKHGDFLK